MKKLYEHKIKNQNADVKGMLNGTTMLHFLVKANKAICEIRIPNGFGSGFFCKIPFTENNNLLLPVLLTNNHVLSRNLLISNNDIQIVINGKIQNIPLKQRKKWTDEKLDFTCIEIKEQEDNIHTFYNIDDNAFYSNYINHKVIVFGINVNDKRDLGFSNGIITNTYGNFFTHNCNTFSGCSGGCIVDQATNNVIGIHKGSYEKEENVGIYIRNVINCIKLANKHFAWTVNIYYSYYFIIASILLLFLLFYYSQYLIIIIFI